MQLRHFFDNSPKHLTQPQITYILSSSTNEYSQSYEQEKYLASHGNRKSGTMETDTTAVKEWAWELKSEIFCLAQAKQNE